MHRPAVLGKHMVRFGAFELDPCSRELRKHGHRIRLQDQPLAVLVTLLERPGEPVSREKLHQTLWPADTFVDFDHGLNNAIKRLREALCDSADKPLFIETIPRLGYRFIAPIRIEQLPAAPSSAQVIEADSKVVTNSFPAKVPPLTGRRWLRGASATIAGLILIATGWTWFAKRGMITEVTGILPVTTYAGDESQPSLSPDGRQVAFSWGGETGENRDIYVTLIGEQQPLRLTSDPAEDAYPAWSPDGKHIAFIRRHAGTQAEIILISAIGGPERILRSIRLGAWITGRMLAWSPDGNWLCFTTEIGRSGKHALFLLSPDTGSVRKLLTEQDNGDGDSSPAFSPDGRWLAFGRFIFPYFSKLLLQRLSADLKAEGEPLAIAEAGVNPKGPVWTPDGKRVLFVEGTRIMQAEIGRPARPFYISAFGFSEITLAGSGPRPRLVASLQNKGAEVWILPLRAKGLAVNGNARRILPSTAGEGHPRFSPDGRRLAFRSSRSGASEIWLADSDGTNPRQLTHISAYAAGYPHWSPDGQFLVFHARFPGEPQLYVARVGDGVVRQVTRSKPGFATPSWSIDGRTLYANARIDGETGIYSVSAQGGVPKLLWRGADAVEAPGRKLLLYDKEDESGIYARSLTGDPAKNPERLLLADFQAPWGGFYPFEDGIYYVGYGSSGCPRAFRFYSFDTGKSVDIAPSPTNLDMGLTVTPDRTRLAFSTKSQGNEDLVQIETK
jgi:Tol biopolymer transport system component/DNA-binding winged helix-turn-helix (wHTH) protein